MPTAWPTSITRRSTSRRASLNPCARSRRSRKLRYPETGFESIPWRGRCLSEAAARVMAGSVLRTGPADELLAESWTACRPGCGSFCFAQNESKIHGSWKSEIELTSTCLLKYVNLDDHQKKSFQILFGRTTITFDPNGTGTVNTVAYDIPTSDGRPLNMAEQSSTFSYKILGETDDQLVTGLKGIDRLRPQKHGETHSAQKGDSQIL